VAGPPSRRHRRTRRQSWRSTATTGIRRADCGASGAAVKSGDSWIFPRIARPMGIAVPRDAPGAHGRAMAPTHDVTDAVLFSSAAIDRFGPDRGPRIRASRCSRALTAAGT
jgi:hypothetical protein